MAISRSVNIDQLEGGVQDSTGAVNVSHQIIAQRISAGAPFTAFSTN